MKHDDTYNEAIQRAETDFRAADGREMVEKCPYLFSSNMADAYWITAFSLYHSGQKPQSVHKSRGRSWVVDFPGWGATRCWVVAQDQREGVRLGGAR